MLFIFIVVYLFKVIICEPSSQPVVKLPLGIVEGFTAKTENGQTIYSFEGIPYAQPPVDDLRFENPVPPKNWKGIWQAKTLFKCMQYNHYNPPGPDKVIGDEDCLYVNIYTPTLDVNAMLDVLVYIHGGAFMFNHGGQTHPDILLDRNIIFVNLNYRLGPLGFLSTEDELVPGNIGIRDQNMALRWIKDNIKQFGGNKNSITISGMSAGGASVQTHLLTPHSKGLFSKAISQSGVVLNSWVLMETPLNKSKTLSLAVGCPTENNQEMMNCLKSKPGRQIVDAVKHFQPWLYNPFSPFGLVVDTWAKDPIFPEHPYQLLKKGLVQDLPWIISYTSSEGLYPGSEFYDEDHLKYIDKNWNNVMPYILHYNDVVPTKQLDKISNKIRKEYLQDERVNKQTFAKLIQLLSDRLFIADINLASRLHAASIKSLVYSYYFNYRGARSRSEARTKSAENIVIMGAKVLNEQQLSDILASDDFWLEEEITPEQTLETISATANDESEAVHCLLQDGDKSEQEESDHEIFSDHDTDTEDEWVPSDQEDSRSDSNDTENKNKEDYGVAHGDDTAYVFKMFDVLSTTEDRAMSKLMVDLFVSFMKTGKPNITSDWLPLSKKTTDSWVQLRIDSPHKIYLEKKTEIGNPKFWQSLPFQENGKLFINKDEL